MTGKPIDTDALMALYNRLLAQKAERRANRNKRQITLRIDGDIIDHYRAGGRFWQRRINEALRRAMEDEED